jgi:hypothetical protein
MQALIHVEVRRQDSQLGQDLPRADLMRMTNRALLSFSHYGNDLCAKQKDFCALYATADVIARKSHLLPRLCNVKASFDSLKAKCAE